MEAFLDSLQTLNPLLIYGVLFAIAFLENIVPPAPSDTIIVFGGSLVGLGVLDFVPALLSATAGSAAGFVAMYKIGEWFGVRILEERKPRFLPVKALKKVEVWFQKYGYGIIVANRFLAGTRAVVSFFAGMSRLKLLITTMLSIASALAWNSILIAGGYLLGQNWRKIGEYAGAYSSIVTGVLVVLGLAALLWWWLARRRGRAEAE